LSVLGSGGQGEVLKVSVDGEVYAVKLYHKHAATENVRAQLQALCSRRLPSGHFVFPKELVASDDGRFGYTMNLLPESFVSTTKIVKRDVCPTFRTLLVAASELAEAFFQLHALGLCYQDVSFANVFIEPTTGQVKVIDNDNIQVPGSRETSVLGTPRFMAPEIVLGLAKPDAQTDRFSLAVLLFYLLLNGHPLEGKLEWQVRSYDAPAQRRLLGEAPVYIFHPTDESNRPVPGVHDNPRLFSQIYPRVLMGAFERAFVLGLTPHQRVLESEWRQILGETRDMLMRCQSVVCRGETEGFWDTRAATGSRCWRCKFPLHPKYILEIKNVDGSRMVLEEGAELYAHHLHNLRGNYSTPLGVVMRDSAKVNQLVLKNNSGRKWTMRGSNGVLMGVPAGGFAPIELGAVFHFGRVDAAVTGPSF